MSKLLKTFSDTKTALDFVGIINDLNQCMKNSKGDSLYTIKDGVSYAYKSLTDDKVHNILYFNVLSNRNKKNLNDDIKLINGIVQGKKLFNWIKEFKKFITSVELYDDHFVILTSNKNKFFTTLVLEGDNYKIDYKPFNNYLKRINIDKKKPIFVNENFEEILNMKELDKAIIPYEYKFSYKTKKKDGTKVKKVVKFRLTKKLFSNFKKTSTVKLECYVINSKDKVYVIKFTLVDKNIEMINYCTIINY